MNQVINNLKTAGIAENDAESLRRIAMTLHAWFEKECGGGNNWASWAIERDEKTDKPYLVTYPHDGKSFRQPIRDREKGAERRLDAIMEKYPDLKAYIQTDPRGASLYILRKGDITGEIDSCYSNGIAVYK